jgi:tetratricopeptide (TPR) repeat protein
MEYVEGETLERWLSQPHPRAEVLRVLCGAGEGLSAAHAAGIVHRDFKPDNVLMGKDGRPRVTDFGLARAPRPSESVGASLPPGLLQLSPSTQTPMGALLGTPAYMAPEQLDGAQASQSSDLFAFCTVIFMALYGVRPFEGTTLFAIREAIRAGRVREPPRGSRVPQWLNRLVVSGLRADPAARPTLRAIIEGLRSAEARRSRRATVAAGLGVAALGVVAALAVERAGMLVSLRRSTPVERQVTEWLSRAAKEGREHGMRARREVLQQADAAVPGSPRVLLEMGATLLSMNAEAVAIDAFARAWLRKDELSPDERARLEIFRLSTQRQFDAAISLARARWNDAPADVERGLQLTTALAMAHKLQEYFVVVDALHRLPPPAGTDPRIDIQETRAAREAHDLPRALEAARRAYKEFEARGDRIGMSRARLAEGSVIQTQGGDPAAVRRALSEARAIAQEAHDDLELANADATLSQTLLLAGDLEGARPLLEEAIGFNQRLGNKMNEGLALLNLSNLLRRQRDLPAAIARMTAAQTIFLELGDRARAAQTLSALGFLRNDLGDLAGAAAALEQALVVQRELKETIGVLNSLVALVEVRISQGDLAEARRVLAEARANSAKATKRTLVSLAWLDALLGLASAAWVDAEAAAAVEARDAHASGFVDEEAEAEALRARALIEEGKLGPAREAVKRGQALLAATRSNVSRAAIAVADGLLLAREDPGHLGHAESVLESALAGAMSAGAAADQWEARLALATVRARGGKSGARAGLEELFQQARAQGFGLYARHAQAALARR